MLYNCIKDGTNIDLPYNTGNYLVYNDKFAMESKERDMVDGTRDEYGDLLQKNQKFSNHYHANCPNMIYPRLKIAKELLTEDGVVFISIDDNEQANALKLLDSVTEV